MRKEFIHIKAAFIDDAHPSVIYLYCNNPGFTYAQLKDGVITTIGKLKRGVVEWLENSTEKSFCVGESTTIKFIKVEAPASKAYKVKYGSVHHIDER